MSTSCPSLGRRLLGFGQCSRRVGSPGAHLLVHYPGRTPATLMGPGESRPPVVMTTSHDARRGRTSGNQKVGHARPGHLSLDPYSASN